MESSSAILERLLTLHPREIDLSLERIERLMATLGHPEEKLPPVIHIGGTNGKGSTTAFMRAMLEAAGHIVHVYTSPHLVRFHERIRLGATGGGRLVEEAELVEALLEVERRNQGVAITQFEITTAAAFLLFARHRADFLLLEVGLGGRLDATNILRAPLASVITPLSIDHEKFLGGSIEEIAAEKAGIIKKRRPAIIAPQLEAALAVIEARAEEIGAPLFLANQDWVVFAEHGRLVYQDTDGLLDLPPPRLAGRHQFTNAGTAIATLRRAGIGLSSEAFAAGLAQVDWPARLQRLSSGILAEEAGAEAELWLDGGHNPGAGAVIAEAMADLEDRVAKPLILITGMLTTKDPVGFFQPFHGLAQRVFTVPVPGHAGRDAEELAGAARQAGLAAEAASDVRAVLRVLALADFSQRPRILICGSLYLAGSVLAENGTPPR